MCASHHRAVLAVEADRDPYVALVGANRCGRIEGDPSQGGKIDLRPFMQAGWACSISGHAIARDEACRNPEKAGAGDENMSEVARATALQSKGLNRGAGGVLVIGVIGQRLVQRAHQSMHGVEGIGRAICRLCGEAAQRPVDVSERAVAQIHLRRQPFDCTPDHARRVARLHLTRSADREALDKSVVGIGHDRIAMRVLALSQRAIGVDVAPPAQDVLAVERERRQPQDLVDRAGRRGEAVDDLVRNPDPHVGAARPFSGEEILLGDRGREARVVLDELGDELVEAALENLGHARTLEPGVHCPRLALGDAASPVFAGERIERAVDALVAGDERARHCRLQDQEVGDQPRLDPVAIDPMIGGRSGDRAQDRHPLEIIERSADGLRRGQEQMIFDVEQARRVVGALDEYAEPVEPVGVVAQHRAVARAVEIERRLLDIVEEAHELLAVKRTVAAPARFEPLELEPGVVDRGPRLGSERGAHRAPGGARILEAITN